LDQQLFIVFYLQKKQNKTLSGHGNKTQREARLKPTSIEKQKTKGRKSRVSTKKEGKKK